MVSVISNLIIPLMVLLVILYGLFKKVDIYDAFVDGAKDSFDMIAKIFPCILGMLLGVNILLNLLAIIHLKCLEVELMNMRKLEKFCINVKCWSLP